jgi:nitroreductase
METQQPLIITEETMLLDLITKNRSYRRFDQQTAVSMDTLRELVNLARLSPSGRNVQPLKYYLACDPQVNQRIFPLLGWAGYLKDWPGPIEGERPAAYIIILGDKNISASFGVDHGIAAQSIMLGAVERGLGGCIVATVHRQELIAELNIPDQFEVLLVLALGKPVEEVVIDPLGVDDDISYWRDDRQVHHVPKRSLEEIIIN